MKSPADDAKCRFSPRVADYVKYRPGYPRQLLELCAQKLGLTPASAVADVGCGTGISSKIFLENGNEVFGVEPNFEMRGAAAEYLQEFPKFHAVDGAAEATTLADHSVDLILCAQAFHWVDHAAAALEFRRIAKTQAGVAIVWNERKKSSSAFLEDYEKLLMTYCTDYAKVSAGNTSASDLTKIFDVPFDRTSFPNAQHFDFDGLKGRVMSSSYVPLAGQPGHDQIMQGIRELFDRFQVGGKVTFDYDTEVFHARLP